MVFEHSSYRSFLKSALAERIAENPAYSLRALAKKLDLAPSTLSEVLKGIKNLSPKTALDVAIRLGLEDAESDYFCLLVQFESTKDAELKNSILKKLKQLCPERQVHDLSVDVFKTIADWYHLPILEMTRLKDFDFNPSSIARRLGISKIEAEVALERLERLELLEKTPQGRYRKTDSRLLTEALGPNQALRKFHRQMLEKAIASLETQTPQEKFIGSETFPIQTEQLSRARALTERYFDEMVKLSAQTDTPNHVYHLGVQFFNLTPISERKNNS